MNIDRVLFDEMEHALKKLRARAEHFSDHPVDEVSKKSHLITEFCDEIGDCIASIEGHVK